MRLWLGAIEFNEAEMEFVLTEIEFDKAEA
jgi:hypothetical protein